MKKIINSLICTFLIAGSAFLAGCHDPEDVIDSLELDRALSPLNFELKLEANVNATFTWTPLSSSKQYKLSLVKAEDGTTYREIVLTDDGASSTMTYQFLELPGNTRFKGMLVALSTVTGNSKAVELAFETGLEQLFLNDGVVADDDVTATTATMRWIPESNVTHLDVDNGIGQVTLDAAAKAAGVYQLTELTLGTTYTVNLCRDDAVRGTCTFVASDKATVEVVDKSASTLTVAWSDADNVTSLKLDAEGQEPVEVTLSEAEKSARKYRFTALTAQTEYRITFFNAGIESGTLMATTLGQVTAWDFTTWAISNWIESTTIDELTIMANGSGKNIEIRADADFGVNYLDLRGKSTVKTGEAPTERALKFPVSSDGVIVIDCYANGSGRNFYAWVDILGSNVGPVEAPVLESKGKIYIPCTGITRNASISLWTDATINHIYSIEWYEGSEAPGQHATPLATPVVTAAPAQVTVGDATEVAFSWGAVANAVAYDWRIKVTYAGDPETTETLSGTTSATRYALPAATVKALKTGSFTMSVTAKPESEYKFKPSAAGSAVLTVLDTKLATPVVTLTPNRVEAGSSTAVTASWEAVADAASYDVTFNGGAVQNQTGVSYAIPAATVAALAEGSYTISVVAKPAAADKQISDAGEAALTIFKSTGSGTAYFWGAEDFDAIWTGFASSTGDITAASLETMTVSADLTKDTDSFTYKGLSYLFGGGKCKFAQNNNAEGVKATRIQFGGTGSLTKANLSFTVDAPGTLVLEAVSGGTTERPLAVAVGDVELTPQNTPVNSGNAVKLTYDCSSAVSGSKITIYSKSSGINLFSISWTPSAN